MVKRVPGPDGLEKGLRLGCGALLGFALVGPFAINLWHPNMPAIWWTVAAGVLVCALLALRYGDRFWHGFAARWRAWWPFWP